jgi:hypothetical protein
MDHRELGRLDSLAPEFREAAVKEIRNDQDQRVILADLAMRGDLNSRRKVGTEEILGSSEISPDSAMAWKDWAPGLPVDEKTVHLQLESMALWAVATKAEAEDFAAIPEGYLRDGAMAGGVARYLECRQ